MADYASYLVISFEGYTEYPPSRTGLILHRFRTRRIANKGLHGPNRRRIGEGGEGVQGPRGTRRQVPGFVPVRACALPVRVCGWCRAYRPAPTRCIQGISLTNPLIIPGGRRPGRILRALRVCIPRAGPYDAPLASPLGRRRGARGIVKVAP